MCLDLPAPEVWRLSFGRRLPVIRAGLAGLLLFTAAVRAQDPAPARVVVLYTHDRSLPGNIRVDQGFRAELQAREGVKAEVFQEYLDMARFPGPERDAALEEYLRRRYAEGPPQALVAVGGPALEFFMQRRASLFPGAPLVLVGIAPERLKALAADPLVTGVEQSFRIGPTLDAMLKMRPGLRRVVLVSGASEFDRLWDGWVDEERARLAGRVELIHWAGEPLSEVLEKARKLPPDTAIFYLSYLRDPDGTTMTSYHAGGQIAGAASVPVFGVYETYIGGGVVGGQVNDLSLYGVYAARIVSRLLAGETPAQIEVAASPPQRFVFDARQIERWKIPQRDLPHGSELLFARRSVWEEHPRVMMAGTVAVLVQSALIAGLLIHRRRRKRAEEHLRQVEALYRGIVNNQAELVCRFREDTTLTFVNDAYCGFFGQSREELLGTSVLSLVPPDKRAAVRGFMEDVGRDKVPLANERLVTRPNGDPRWISWLPHPILDAQGNLTELQGVGRDITQRKLAEEALRQSEERFAGVFRASPAGISVIRQSDGRLVDVNPSWERFFEIGRDQAVGSTPGELGLIASLESDRRFQAFLESGESLRNFDQMVRTRGGTTRWMSVSGVLVPLGGEPCFVVMSKDITEQREAEDARRNLVQATRLAMLGELTASIAHEVNQPLGAILSNADAAELLLGREEPPLADIRQILADIRRDDLRAHDVIKRVRALVGKRSMIMEPLDLNDLLVNITRLVAHESQRRGVTITRDFALNLPVIQGDRVQLEQIVLNLLLNAMDAVKDLPAGHRRLALRSTRKDAGWIEVAVEDNGHGISPEKLARIFDSFFTTKEDGMGLGLALARSIAETHGGRLAAENNPAGGATFRLILPVFENS